MGNNVFDLDAWLEKKRSDVAAEGPAGLQDVGAVPGMQGALLGALKRSAEPKEESPWNRLGRMTTFGTAPTPEEARTMSAEHIPEFATAAALAPAALAGGVGPLLKGLALSGAGAAGGGYLGRAGGKGLEYAGAPEGTADVLGKVGGLAGGLVAPFAGPAASAAVAEAIPSHSVTGSIIKTLLRRLAGSAAGEVPAAAATTAATAARRGAAVPSDLVQSLMRGESSLGKMSREAAEAIAARMGGAAPTAAKDAATIASEVAAARRTAEVSGALSAEKQAVLEASRAARAAKAEDALLEAARRKQALQGALQPERIQIGAERVGRTAGLTKEEVRRQAGPVLDELAGEASPVLPRKALGAIVDAMKPLSMAEREAYVARATSGKAKWQVENIRRTLEHLGLLLPAGAVMAAGRQE